MYRGIEPSPPGPIMGHEFMGEIVEVGSDVKTLQKGDRVVSAFTTSWYVFYSRLLGLIYFMSHIVIAASASTASRDSLPVVRRTLSSDVSAWTVPKPNMYAKLNSIHLVILHTDATYRSVSRMPRALS